MTRTRFKKKYGIPKIISNCERLSYIMEWRNADSCATQNFSSEIRQASSIETIYDHTIVIAPPPCKLLTSQTSGGLLRRGRHEGVHTNSRTEGEYRMQRFGTAC